MTSGILLALLGLLLIGLALGFAWQGRRVGSEDLVIYSVEDSIQFVAERLGTETALKPTDVRRILEWEVRYLQDPGVRGEESPVVAGGLPSAEYAQKSLALLGHAYDGPEIIEVLDLRAEYLSEIGAVGEPLSAAEVSELESIDRESSSSAGEST